VCRAKSLGGVGRLGIIRLSPDDEVGTGNNLRLVGDLTRRAVIARLDPKTDRPEIRQFDYDPLIDSRENRAELVAAGAHHPQGLLRRRHAR
jgi:hypothetical protein